MEEKVKVFINKAIIIENPSQLNQLKKILRENSVTINIPNIANIEYPYYEMIYKFDTGLFGIPNGTLKGSDTGIYELGFEICTIKQLKNLLAER